MEKQWLDYWNKFEELRAQEKKEEESKNLVIFEELFEELLEAKK